MDSWKENIFVTKETIDMCSGGDCGGTSQTKVSPLRDVRPSFLQGHRSTVAGVPRKASNVVNRTSMPAIPKKKRK